MYLLTQSAVHENYLCLYWAILRCMGSNLLQLVRATLLKHALSNERWLTNRHYLHVRSVSAGSIGT